MSKRETPTQKARAAEAAEQIRNRWTAVALLDLAAALQLLARLDKVELPLAYRVARLLAEPHDFDPRAQHHQAGSREQVLALANITRRRSEQALQALGQPVPKKAPEAAQLAEAAWARLGERLDMRWTAGLAPGELCTVSPFQVRLAGEGLDDKASARYEPRLDDPLAQNTGLYHSVVVMGRAVRAPVHVDLVDKPLRLEVLAGSRRTRAARAAWRVGLWALIDVTKFNTSATKAPAAKAAPLPPLPPEFRVLVPNKGDDAQTIFVADNLTHVSETPWTTISRLAQGVQQQQAGQSQQQPGQSLSVKDLVAETGLSQRTVTYYLSLATLAPALLIEGRNSRLSLKLGGVLATVPDLEMQVRLFELTRAVSPEAARIEAINKLAQLGPDKLAKTKALEAPPRRTAIGVRAARERLSAASASSPELTLLRTFAAAIDGDKVALAELPPEVRDALAEPQKPVQRRRITAGTTRARGAGDASHGA